MTAGSAPGRVLLCGGAGAIGSHRLNMLHEHGDQVIVHDNLSAGHREAAQAARPLSPLSRRRHGPALIL